MRWTAEANWPTFLTHYVLPTVLLITGAAITLVAQALWRWLSRPRLRVCFKENDERFVLPTRENSTEVRYVRVLITNRKGRIARNCRVHLVGWEEEKNGQWEPTKPRYSDCVPLNWSYEPQLRAVDILARTWRFTDVLSTRKGWHQFRIETAHFPNYCQPLLDRQNRFRFTIQVTAEEASPQHLALEFKWNGVWNNFKVKSLGPVCLHAHYENEMVQAYWRCLRSRWEWLKNSLKKLP